MSENKTLGAEKYRRIDAPDDPERCQSNAANGQCGLKAVKNSKFCHLHGGYAVEKKNEKEQVRIYHLNRWRADLERHADNPGIKSLREEIGILRMVLETRLNSIHDVGDLMIHSNTINETVKSIEKLVVSCHKIEDKMGELIDKKALQHIATRIISAISQTFHDQPEKLGELADKIVSIIQEGAQVASEEEIALETSS